MKTYLTILGSGSSMGVPRADGYWGKCDPSNKKNFRSRCSALITKGKSNILIDTSPDLRLQLISNKINKINNVVYTHEHADQTHGINDLRSFFIQKQKKINVYGNLNTIKYLKKNFSYCFNKTGIYPAILNANIIKKSFSLGAKSEKINFKTFQVKHGKIFTTAYMFNKTAYISDCSSLTNSQIKLLKNINLFIIDCLRFKPHFSHYSYYEILDLIKIIKPKKTILTNLHSDIDYDYISKKAPTNVRPAFDNMKFVI